MTLLPRPLRKCGEKKEGEGGEAVFTLSHPILRSHGLKVLPQEVQEKRAAVAQCYVYVGNGLLGVDAEMDDRIDWVERDRGEGEGG